MLQDMTATRLPWFRLFPFGYEETTWVLTGSIYFNFMFSAWVGARCCLLLGLRVGVSLQMCSPVPTDLVARPDSRICLGERWVSHGRRDSRPGLERLGCFRKLPDLRTDIVIFPLLLFASHMPQLQVLVLGIVHLVIPRVPSDVMEHVQREREVEAFFIGQSGRGKKCAVSFHRRPKCAGDSICTCAVPARR